MAEIQTISETPLSLIELKERLAEVKKRDKELSFRGKKTEEYLNVMVGKQKEKKLRELKEQLDKAEISRLKVNQIIKIVDILPKDIDSLKIIFSSDNITLKQEDMTKILDIVKKYA